jgi:hypothetical protein
LVASALLLAHGRTSVHVIGFAKTPDTSPFPPWPYKSSSAGHLLHLSFAATVQFLIPPAKRRATARCFLN